MAIFRINRNSSTNSFLLELGKNILNKTEKTNCCEPRKNENLFYLFDDTIHYIIFDSFSLKVKIEKCIAEKVIQYDLCT